MKHKEKDQILREIYGEYAILGRPEYYISNMSFFDLINETIKSGAIKVKVRQDQSYVLIEVNLKV